MVSCRISLGGFDGFSGSGVVQGKIWARDPTRDDCVFLLHRGFNDFPNL